MDKISDELFRPLDDYSKELYAQFFVERVEESTFLEARIDEIQKYGGNILVVGDTGTGKTCFLRWFLSSANFIKEHNPVYYFVDLKSKAEDGKKESFIQTVRNEFIKAILEYVRKVYGDPCNEINSKIVDESEAKWTYDLLCKKLQEHKKMQEVLFLFIDDIDYADEQYLGELLLLLKPIMIAKNGCVVLAARNPACNAILSREDFLIGKMFDKSGLLRLSHLPVNKIIKERIKLICSIRPERFEIKYNKSKKWLNYITAISSAINSFLSDPKLPKDTETIEYPLTIKQESFIQETSNGNIRLMLEMAKEYMRYMSHNPSKIVKKRQGYWVGRLALLKHFTRDGIDEKIKIQNLHERKSYQYFSKKQIKKLKIPPEKIGNSLYVVLLESLFEYESINTTRRKQLKEYGFSDDELTEGIQELQSMGMIDIKVIADRRAIGVQTYKTPDDFIITRRGKYYMGYMIHWDEYIELYGKSNHHKNAQDDKTKEAVRCSLLEFLADIIIVRSNSKDLRKDFKISKKVFHEYFCKLSKDVLTKLNMTDKLSPINLSIDNLTMYLIELKVIKKFEVERYRNYLFYTDNIKKVHEQKGAIWRIVFPYFKDDISEFNKKYVRNPEYEEK